jgi:hypothetical protein
MTVLFALIPSLVALAIFVGTFRLTPPRFVERARPRGAVATSRPSNAIRTPLPLGAPRRLPAAQRLQA